MDSLGAVTQRSWTSIPTGFQKWSPWLDKPQFRLWPSQGRQNPAWPISGGPRPPYQTSQPAKGNQALFQFHSSLGSQVCWLGHPESLSFPKPCFPGHSCRCGAPPSLILGAQSRRGMVAAIAHPALRPEEPAYESADRACDKGTF